MNHISHYASHITLTLLVAILLIGSWIAGQSSRADGQTDTILGVTFALLIPFALGVLYLQNREEIEE